MSTVNLHTVVNTACNLLEKQEFIPSQLLEERNGATCMCTGAALLFAAHLTQTGDGSITRFFAELSAQADDEFVEEKAATYGLDPSAVHTVIINTKAMPEFDRATAITRLLCEFAAQHR